MRFALLLSQNVKGIWSTLRSLLVWRRYASRFLVFAVVDEPFRLFVLDSIQIFVYVCHAKPSLT